MNLVILLTCILCCLIGGARPQEDCQHGGIHVINVTEAKDYCSCPPYWGGQFCGDLQCANGGYPSPDDPTICVCPTGYHGVHCDPVGPIPSPDTTFNIDATVHFVVVNLFTPDLAAQSLAAFQSATISLLNSTTFQTSGILYSTAAPKDAKESNDPAAYEFQSVVSPGNVTGAIASMDGHLNPYKYACFNVPFASVVHKYVKDNQLQHTTLNLLTQRPPSCDKSECDDLVATLIAFDIRLNVFFSYDALAHSCSPDDAEPLRDISRLSGGQFVVYVNDVGVMTTLLSTTYKPQLVASAATTDSSTEKVTMPVILDKLQTGYHYLFISGGFYAGATNCYAMSAASTSDSSFSIYRIIPNPVTQVYECSIMLNATSQLYSQLYSFDYDSVDSVSINTFVSFVDHQGLDSAVSYPNEGNPLYVRVHYEAAKTEMQLDSAVVYSAAGGTMNLTFAQAPLSTFDLVSNEQIACTKAANPYSIQLRFLSSADSATVQQRSIYFNCYDQPADPEPTTISFSTTAAGVSNDDSDDFGKIKSTEAVSTTAEADGPTTTPQPVPCEIFTEDVKSTLVIAVSDANDIAKYNTFAVATMANQTQSYFQNYGAIRYDGLDSTVNTKYTRETPDGLFLDIYNNFKPTNQENAPQFSDILTKLSDDITNGIRTDGDNTDVQKYIPQSSLVSVALGRLPETAKVFNPDDYQQLIHQNTKVVFFLDYDNAVKQLLGQPSTLSGLSTLAALTDGHLIISNQSEVDSYFNALRAVYDYGPAQQLIYSQNFIGGRINLAAPLNLFPLGSSDDKVTVSFTATTSRYDADSLPDARAYFFNLTLVGDDGTSQTLILNTDFPQDPLSNFYFSNVTLRAGQNYALKIFYASSQPNDIVYLRAWVDNKLYRKVHLRYEDLNDAVQYEIDETNKDPQHPDLWKQTTSTAMRYPNSVDGAIVRATVRGGNSGTLAITMLDCNGQPLGLLDEYQPVDHSSAGTTGCSDHYFVPYFCLDKDDDRYTEGNCVPGTKGKFTMQITGDGVSVTRSYYCAKNNSTVQADTDYCHRPDRGGDYQCTYPTQLLRGPSGQVYDCSGTGKLKYDQQHIESNSNDHDIKYTCACNPGSADKNCADAKCDVMNTRAGADDTSYRTYTVALVQGGYASATVKMGAKLLMQNESSPTVWIYQLLEFCGENVAVRYFGPSQKQFNDAFAALNETLHCETTDTTDLIYVYKTAVGGLGPQHRGLLTVFATDANNVVAGDLADFYDIARRYRQEMFVFIFPANDLGVYDNQKIGEIAFATGGSVIVTPQRQSTDVQPFPDLMLNANPSLNYHVVVNGVLDPTVVETKALVFYSGLPKVVTLTGPTTVGSTKSPYWGSSFIVDGATTIDFGGIGASPYSISVLAIGDKVITPAYCLVSGQTSDAPSTLAVATTNTRARLVVKVDDVTKVDKAIPSDTSRILKRTGCTFNVLSYDVFKNFDGQPGSKTLTLKVDTDPTYGPIIKYFPVIVTANNDVGACLNGGVWTVDHCECLDGFMGPDCSLVSSCNDGTPNTWGTACTCKDADGTEGTGRTCSVPRQPPAPATSSLWHDFL